MYLQKCARVLGLFLALSSSINYVYKKLFIYFLVLLETKDDNFIPIQLQQWIFLTPTPSTLHKE